MADGRAPQSEQPAQARAPRLEDQEQQREHEIELLLDTERPEVDAVHPRGLPRDAHELGPDPRVEEDPPVHHVEDVHGQVRDADRGGRHAQHEVVGGKDSQRAARVEALEHLAARPVLERDQDPGNQKSTDHEEQ